MKIILRYWFIFFLLVIGLKAEVDHRGSNWAEIYDGDGYRVLKINGTEPMRMRDRYAVAMFLNKKESVIEIVRKESEDSNTLSFKTVIQPQKNYIIKMIDGTPALAIRDVPKLK